MANSEPLSNVMVFGVMPLKAFNIALNTDFADISFDCAARSFLDFLSINVTIQPFPGELLTVSPSQSPNLNLISASVGLS